MKNEPYFLKSTCNYTNVYEQSFRVEAMSEGHKEKVHMINLVNDYLDGAASE